MPLKQTTLPDWIQAQLDAQIAAGNYPAGTELSDIILPSDYNALVVATESKVTAAEAADAAPVQSVAGKTGDVLLDKADVGLENIDNTSDVDKPISAETQAALDDKLGISGTAAAVSTISGLISAGSGVTMTGEGTAEDPYVVNSTSEADIIALAVAL